MQGYGGEAVQRGSEEMRRLRDAEVYGYANNEVRDGEMRAAERNKRFQGFEKLNISGNVS